jgi:transposase
VYNYYTVSILFLRKFSVKFNPISNLKILKINPLKTSVLIGSLPTKEQKPISAQNKLKQKKKQPIHKTNLYWLFH